MIIGLSGYAKSGKDYTARILIDKFGFERRAFADAVRNVLYDMNPHVRIGYDIDTTVQLMVNHEGWDYAKSIPEVRQALQSLGTSMRKHMGDTVWIDRAFHDLDATGNYVFSDVRFRNEADAIKEIGGQIWRVKRPGVMPINTHISEIDMDYYDVDQTLISDDTVLEQIEAFLK